MKKNKEIEAPELVLNIHDLVTEEEYNSISKSYGVQEEVYEYDQELKTNKEV